MGNEHKLLAVAMSGERDQQEKMGKRSYKSLEFLDIWDLDIFASHLEITTKVFFSCSEWIEGLLRDWDVNVRMLLKHSQPLRTGCGKNYQVH